MERTGIEPVTSGLQSRLRAFGAFCSSSALSDNRFIHAGLRAPDDVEPETLRRAFAAISLAEH